MPAQHTPNPKMHPTHKQSPHTLQRGTVPIPVSCGACTRQSRRSSITKPGSTFRQSSTPWHSRALLILHALVQEAIRRGWEVIPNPSKFEVDRWNGRRKRASSDPDLFSIDAGDAPAAIRFRVQQKKVDHEPTEKERDEQAKYSWSRHPKYDYIPTDRLRLEIRSGSSNVLTLDDTANTRIEDKLL